MQGLGGVAGMWGAWVSRIGRGEELDGGPRVFAFVRLVLWGFRVVTPSAGRERPYAVSGNSVQHDGGAVAGIGIISDTKTTHWTAHV